MAVVAEATADVNSLQAENEKLKRKLRAVEELLQRERDREAERSSNGSSMREIPFGLETSLTSLTLDGSNRSIDSDSSSLGGWKCSKWHGLKARPEFAKRICAHKKKKANDMEHQKVHHLMKKKTVMQKVEENQELLESYGQCTAGLLEVLKNCQEVDWPDDIPYLPLAERLRDAAIPRLSFDKFAAMIEDCQDAVILELEHGTEEKYGGVEEFWPSAPDMEPFLSNKKQREEAGTVEQYKEWRSRNKFVVLRWEEQIGQSIMDAVFQDGDVQPFREFFFKFGTLFDAQDWNAAQMKVMKMSPCLVEKEGKIYFGIIKEPGAKLAHPRELKDRAYMSTAIFRYTQICLVVFSMDGIILQQNPASMPHFGIVASTNTTFMDVEADGVTPVNRLRALFGHDQKMYDKMWRSINDGERNYFKSRVKIYRKNMRPHKQHIDFAEDDYIWWDMYVHKFRDPSTGNEVICMDLKDITSLIEKEERLKEMRQHEHSILGSMIPEHILEFLIEEKRSQKVEENIQNSLKMMQDQDSMEGERLGKPFSVSSTSSESSEMLLSLSNVQDMSDNRVASLAEHHEDVTILFTDIVGFTKISSTCSPAEVMIMLNKLFSIFDLVSERHNIYKVETIGDAYMCAAGLNLKTEKEKLRAEAESFLANCKGTNACPVFHATRMLNFAQDILKDTKDFVLPNKESLQIRIGVHTGDCMTGIVGMKMPRFCLFGDTVNTASRMESNGVPGRIHVSKTTRDLLSHLPWSATGGVHAKGKGVMETFLLE